MGKDNIVFHTVIWPGILLGHNGEGDHGGTVGPLGELRLPDELVSSEYLTMSGSKFSTSRGKVIYVGDFLRDFGPDALRYYIAVAGPETADTDFTWDEFVRRTNFELANEWGNLVNRSISMAYKNNGAIPAPKTLLDIDHDLLRTSREAFDTVGALLGRSRFKLAITEAMRLVGAANKYISDTEPWKLAGDPERRDTVLHTALQVVSDANTLLTPFLPCRAAGSSGSGRDRSLGGRAGDPRGDRGGRARLSGDHGRLRRGTGPLGLSPDYARYAATAADPAVPQTRRVTG